MSVYFLLVKQALLMNCKMRDKVKTKTGETYVFVYGMRDEKTYLRVLKKYVLDSFHEDFTWVEATELYRKLCNRKRFINSRWNLVNKTLS